MLASVIDDVFAKLSAALQPVSAELELYISQIAPDARKIVC